MAESRREQAAEVREYLGVLRRRAGVVVAVVVVATSAALVFSLLQDDVYEANAQVLLQSRSTEALFESRESGPFDPDRTMRTEIEVLQSAPVKAEVERRLGGAPDVSASGVEDTDVLSVRARDRSPDRAARIANAYADAYIDIKRTSLVEAIVEARQLLQRRIDDLQAQIDTLNERVENASDDERAAVEDTVAGQRNSLYQQQASLQQTSNQLQYSAEISTGGAQLVTPAKASSAPVEPQPIRSASLAAGIGLLLGIGLAFLRDFLDDSVKDAEDVARVADDVPVLATVPIVGTRDTGRVRVVSLTDPHSAAAESYRSLRTAIQFMSLDRPVRTLLFTSCNQAEGKTTTVANVGVALAGAAVRVALIDFDLRRPQLHALFGLDNSTGFTSALLGRVDTADALQDIGSGRGYLKVLPAGPLPPNPSELLSSPRVPKLLDAATEHVDAILIDSPPVLPVTDPVVTSQYVDGVVLVVGVGTTTRRQLHAAIERLRHVGAPVVGVVLNRAAENKGYYVYGERTRPTRWYERSNRRRRVANV